MNDNLHFSENPAIAVYMVLANPGMSPVSGFGDAAADFFERVASGGVTLSETGRLG